MPGDQRTTSTMCQKQRVCQKHNLGRCSPTQSKYSQAHWGTLAKVHIFAHERAEYESFPILLNLWPGLCAGHKESTKHTASRGTVRLECQAAVRKWTVTCEVPRKVGDSAEQCLRSLLYSDFYNLSNVLYKHSRAARHFKTEEPGLIIPPSLILNYVIKKTSPPKRETPSRDTVGAQMPRRRGKHIFTSAGMRGEGGVTQCSFTAALITTAAWLHLEKSALQQEYLRCDRFCSNLTVSRNERWRHRLQFQLEIM